MTETTNKSYASINWMKSACSSFVLLATTSMSAMAEAGATSQISGDILSYLPGALIATMGLGLALRYRSQAHSNKAESQGMVPATPTPGESNVVNISDYREAGGLDAITGLPNRILFNDRLEQAVIQSKRSEQKVGLILLEISDGISQRGIEKSPHEAAILGTIAKQLESCLRESDTVAYLGQGEYGILLTNVDGRESISQLAGKVKALFDQPLTAANKQHTLQPLIGTSMYPANLDSSADVYADAEMNLIRLGLEDCARKGLLIV